MAPSLIIGLILVILYGRVAAEESGEDPSVSSLSLFGCSYCCSRIDNQTKILNRISNASDQLTKDVGEIKTGVVDNIPSQLTKQASDLDALKTFVGTDIPSKLETQSSELKQLQASVKDIGITLDRHSESLIVHDDRLQEQAVLLGKLSSLVKGE